MAPLFNNKGIAHILLVLLTVAALATVGMVIYTAVKARGSTEPSTSPTGSSAQTEGPTFCDGWLSGTLPTGWYVKEGGTAKIVGTVIRMRLACTLIYRPTDFHVGVNEAFAGADRAKELLALLVEHGDSIDITVNERLSLADGTPLLHMENEFQEFHDHPVGVVHYVAVNPGGHQLSIGYQRSDLKGVTHDEVESMITSLSLAR